MTRIMRKQEDVRDRPAYTVPEAAGYLKISAPTLRSWAQEPDRSDTPRNNRLGPLIEPASESPLRLSFNNLVECHTLRALRTRHGVSIKSALDAMGTVKVSCNTKRFLLSDQLRTDADEIFLDEYGRMTNLIKSGRLAMKAILEELLKSIDRDEFNLPRRFYSLDGEKKIIVIDPCVAFGRPVIRRCGISTDAIVTRLDATEREEDIAKDYDLTLDDIRRATIYERAA